MGFDHLFSPFSIGSLSLNNRIVMPPMATNYASSEGFVTGRQIDYYVERAKGGVGYITVEHTGILEQGKASPRMLMISTDEHAARLKKLVDAVHDAEGRIVVQINHAGRQTSSKVTGSQIVGPSAVAVSSAMETPRQLSVPEIVEIIAAFTAAAERVKGIGADGVELHMAHGYLLGSFLSPFSNKRNDHYGRDFEARTRFAVETLRSVRSRVGSAFPVICRLSGDEYVEGGLEITQTERIARILEAGGAAALHISACNAASVFLNHPPYYVEEGVFVHLAQAVKSQVKLPVIAVGRIRNPAMADRIVQQGKADLVSMGRALLADPHLPRKAKAGRLDEIIPCISCNRCIQTLRKDSVACTVNPDTGRENQLPLARADRAKAVWIVGGGPAGLKAAETAALRGHRVTLFEKNKTLGGRARIAALPPRKAVLNEFLDYLESRARRLGVTLELDTEFTSDSLALDTPDAVILATGAVPHFPDWEGVADSGALTVDEALTQTTDLGENILVVGGGGIGAELADYLSEKGKRVTLVEMQASIAADLVIHLQHYLLQRLGEKGVTILTSTRVKEVGKDFAIVQDPSGIRRLAGFDTIVLAIAQIANDALLASLQGKAAEIYVIGDASRPREILDAVYEGKKVAAGI